MNLLRCVTSCSFKSLSKDDLIKELIIRATGCDKPENTYSEMGDMFVDHLLLRELLFRASVGFDQLRLLRVCINRCRGNVLSEPVQLGYKIFHLLLDIFKMLGVSV